VTNNKPGFYILSPGNDFDHPFVSVLTPGEGERELRLNNDIPFTLTNKYHLHLENNKPAKKVGLLALKKQGRQNNRHAQTCLSLNIN